VPAGRAEPIDGTLAGLPRVGTSATKSVVAPAQEMDSAGSFDPARLGTGLFI